MFAEMSVLTTTAALACGGEVVETPKIRLPKGNNLISKALATSEPYEIVVLKRMGWSEDASLAHYQILYQNRKRSKKAGWALIGYFVDVSTGKTIHTYQWERKGFITNSVGAH